MNPVYIVATGTFLPNEPISNDEMESVLGQISGKPSRGRAIVLRNNGIKSRYYALNTEKEITHTNAELVVEALKNASNNNSVPKNIDILSCGTSAADQSLPSHTAMVHGLLDEEMEIASPSGACCAGVHAMKYGYMAIASGMANRAIAAGSELISPMMMARNFEAESKPQTDLEKNPYIAFEKDFLRWMLSDGAGCLVMDNQPSGDLNLKIDWIESRSYANRVETCMYSASDVTKDGELKSWKQFSQEEWLTKSVFAMKQDTKLLRENIVKLGGEFLAEICKRRDFDAGTLDYFLPHLSSEFFRQPVLNQLKEDGMDIPNEKCFTNLSRVGNVGSASIYIMLDELIRSGKLEKGNKILLMIPESARFSYAFSLLTVC
jgi:3-oxoacyl-[acyl-carrier-protein] synthase-3